MTEKIALHRLSNAAAAVLPTDSRNLEARMVGTMGRSYSKIYTHTKKYPPGKQKFGDLCPITQEPVHTGRLTLDFIQTTTDALLVTTWPSKEAKCFKEFKNVGLVRYFSS